MNYYFNNAPAAASATVQTASTAPPLEPVAAPALKPVPAPRGRRAPVAKAAPTSVYFQTTYYYSTAGRGTSYYDLEQAPAGRLTPTPTVPPLLAPPKPGASAGK